MSDSDAPREVIREFLVAALGDDTLEFDTDIFELQYVTSLFALELVTFVERKFGIAIDTDDLDLDNFRSADRIESFVQRKRQNAAGASVGAAPGDEATR